MEKNNILMKCIPYDIITLIFEYFSTKQYQYKYATEWIKIKFKTMTKNETTISQYNAIKHKMSQYFENNELIAKITSDIMKLDYNTNNNDNVDDILNNNDWNDWYYDDSTVNTQKCNNIQEF
eukprot:41769_1